MPAAPKGNTRRRVARRKPLPPPPIASTTLQPTLSLQNPILNVGNVRNRRKPAGVVPAKPRQHRRRTRATAQPRRAAATTEVDVGVDELGWIGTLEDLPPNAPSRLSPREQIAASNTDYLAFWTEEELAARRQADNDSALLATRVSSTRARPFLRDPKLRFVKH